MRSLLLLALGLACTPDLEMADDDSTVEDEPGDLAWGDFLERRSEMLDGLSVPILACVAQEDTDHPAFHGCWDWHSAVHGTWALLAIARHTGLAEAQAAANAVLTETALAVEAEDMAGNGLFQEIPYGYAWFLRLAREGAAAHPELLAMGDVAAARLQADTDQLSPLGMELGVTADDYQNVSWVLTNVADWARFREDDTLLQWAEETVRDRVLPLEDVCPLEDDLGPADQFFPPCLLRARAIVRILPLGEAAAWADSALPAEFPIEPLSTATSAHSAGLTWSRAWGLWDLWAFTGDPRWRDAYRAHVLAWYELPQFWAEDYQAYAHWVAQFGVHAIDLSYEGE